MKAGVWIAIAAIVFIAAMIYSTMGLRKNRVEVCMEYQGRRACRTASGETPEKALRAATDNACALIASGVTDTIGCQQTRPVSVKRLD
jgi:hypothetical protein